MVNGNDSASFTMFFSLQSMCCSYHNVFKQVTLTTRMLVSHLSGIRHYEKKKDKDKKDQENEQTKSKSSAKETVSKTDDNKEKPKGKVGEFHMKEYYIKRSLTL